MNKENNETDAWKALDKTHTHNTSRKMEVLQLPLVLKGFDLNVSLVWEIRMLFVVNVFATIF